MKPQRHLYPCLYFFLIAAFTLPTLSYAEEGEGEFDRIEALRNTKPEYRSELFRLGDYDTLAETSNRLRHANKMAIKINTLVLLGDAPSSPATVSEFTDSVRDLSEVYGTFTMYWHNGDSIASKRIEKLLNDAKFLEARFAKQLQHLEIP